MQFTPRQFSSFMLSAALALPALLAPYGSTGLAAQEPVTITGKVTSDAGQALGQVEVAIPAMGLGALSKDDGRYTIVVPGARVSGQTVTLVARRLGYKSQSAQVTLTAGAATHDSVLAANPLQLGQVRGTAAGVILITTKSGRAGPTHFSVRSSTTFDDINHTYPLQTAFGQGLFFVHADTTLGGNCDNPGVAVCARSWAPLAAGATVYDHSN